MGYKPNNIRTSHLAMAVALRFGERVDVADPLPTELFQKLLAALDLHDQTPLEHCFRHQMKGFGTLSDNRWFDALPHVREWGRMWSLDDAGELVMFGRKVACEHEWGAVQRATMEYDAYLELMQQQMAQHLRGEAAHFTTPELIIRHRATALSLRETPLFPRNYPTYDDHRNVAVLACRLRMASLRSRKEELERLARSRDVMRGIEQELGYLEAFLSSPDLHDRLGVPKPRLTDFVNVGVVERDKTGRATDEKFGILTAPGQFEADYAEACEGAFSRGRSFAVGFVDIDKFKDFNEEHDEVLVDRVILPQFMRAIEAYCHGRAYAYRQGGDEYLVLVHNADANEALAFFKGLQRHLADVDYPAEVTRKPTVSIGVYVIDAIHEVTEFEAKKRANEAKKHAKYGGRNCVVVWRAGS